MSSIASTSLEQTDEVFYPSGDGEPIAETPIHVLAIMLLFQALEDFLAKDPDAYLAADMFWYWERGNPQARRAPDVMVSKGVGRAARRSFFSWREHGAVPGFIVEMASEGTWREDLYEKYRLHAELGVREYFIFDPEALHLRPPLQGFRLTERGTYTPLVLDAENCLPSAELALLLRAEGTMLRLIDATTRQPVLTREERAEQERQRSASLEAEVVRLRTLLEQVGAKTNGGQGS